MHIGRFAALGMSFLATAAASAQSTPSTPRQAAEPATSFGSVNGHIYLAGSNLPARFATVTLQPTEIKPESRDGIRKPAEMTFRVLQAGLDGGYSFSRVAPGAYYVVVNKPGYLSPFLQFTHAELERPTPAVQQRIAELLPTVSVQPNAASTRDIRLTRGGSMSGVVRFDDGSPDANARVSLRQRDASGKWLLFPNGGGGATTDDQGQYRVSGLSAGEYLLSVTLQMEERRQDSALGPPMQVSTRSWYSIIYYGGDTARPRDAHPVTLTEGQELIGQDITVPVGKLHAISGAVVDARTGVAVNSGKLELVYSDDGMHVASAEIDYDARSFRFDFVPEGEYKLQIKDAHEARRDESGTPASFPNLAGPPKETVLREYGPAEIAETVQAEMTGITVPVPEKPAGEKGKAATASSTSP